MTTTLPKLRARAVPLFLVLPTLICFTLICEATKIHTIHWNTSNPIFRIDNTDHIIDVNVNNRDLLHEFDQVTIVCPHNQGSRGTTEKFVIYLVEREEYEMCRITNPNPKVVAMCDDPDRVKSFTHTFRPFTPKPGGIEFKPGEDYFFISTSSEGDLYRRVGGWCSTHNMKLVFKVADNKSSDIDDDDETPSVEEESMTYYYDPSSNSLANDEPSENEVKIFKQEASRMEETVASPSSSITSAGGRSEIVPHLVALSLVTLAAGLVK